MSKNSLALILTTLVSLWQGAAGAQDSPQDALSAVPFTQVRFNDDFWAPRLETNRQTTITYCFTKCEETGRIDNFSRAAGVLDGPHVGYRFDDSDVFKVIEGAAYSLAVKRDAELESSLDALIDTIASAQEPDGYLYTARTIDPEHPAADAGDTRWSYIIHSHELYNAGHLYEAAVAYYQATGKRILLDTALRNADLIDRVFGPNGRHDPPGHEEIEIGLMKLYEVTNQSRYLNLARFFIDRRGRLEHREALYGPYSQDAAPVVEQRGPTGHAVRAMYLYCGMADVSASAQGTGYQTALDRIWGNMVQTKLYLTGGVGARRAGEAFGEDYELPNASAYSETCAAIGNAMWNHRMGLLHRDAKYFDVVERILYNGFLSGVSLTGDQFFYPNPLASSGTYHRSPWFSCSCCPVNVARFVPSIPGYVYAHDGAGIYVNLYISSEGGIDLASGRVRIRQETRYPWDGRIDLTVEPERESEFDLFLRIPGWARGKPIPSDLYHYVESDPAEVALKINGRPVEMPDLVNGYARLSRRWESGDTVTIEFAMPIRRVLANEHVEANADRMAFERGPLVYCLEATDNRGYVRNLWIPEDAPCRIEPNEDLFDGIMVVTGSGFVVKQSADGEQTESEPVPFTAIPYYAWDHREAGEMAVWIPTSPDLAQAVPPPTRAGQSTVTASHCGSHDSLSAVNDQLMPASSSDLTIPRFTWWDHRGTAEWIAYQLPERQTVSSVEVYWFDDTGSGQCRTPASWTVMVRVGDAWVQVDTTETPGTTPDTLNRLNFKPVTCSAVRLQVQMKDGYSAGILEWRVN
ncbi:MAG: glycoside hydrolase family 127 protein [Planctomycetes bacterium]|nr:glycoside hydrolase family 127 protein [Planctomycetota bacterium]NOG54367.1 glycoside hydrolase family 127 protein [Planctomycetota bacterium]